jgi:hypothetical protein
MLKTEASYSIGTKIECRILPSTCCDKWPLPVVSSTKITSPTPMTRLSPSLAVIFNRCPAGGADGDVHREVRLYVHGTHDFLTADFPMPNEVNAELEGDAFGWSLATALLCGFQVAFSADESEISSHLFGSPGHPNRRRILLYEVDEGGQGLIVNLTGGSAWQKMARRALEILHVDPITGGETSEAARGLVTTVCSRTTTNSIISISTDA